MFREFWHRFIHGDPMLKKYPCFFKKDCLCCKLKNPIVFVNYRRNYWHCFDCGNGGVVNDNVKNMIRALEIKE